MTLRGTDLESYITEYTLVHENKRSGSQCTPSKLQIPNAGPGFGLDRL